MDKNHKNVKRKQETEWNALYDIVYAMPTCEQWCISMIYLYIRWSLMWMRATKMKFQMVGCPWEDRGRRTAETWRRGFVCVGHTSPLELGGEAGETCFLIALALTCWYTIVLPHLGSAFCWFSYPRSIEIWKYSMGHSRNKQLLSFKLCAVLSRVMESCDAQPRTWRLPWSSISML